jgi:hypothetical protein
LTVTDVAFEIGNSIHGNSLQRLLFNLTLDEGTRNIILRTGVRELSRYNFLQRFCSLLSEIQTFWKESGDEWVFDLIFLAEFTGILSDMNLELQGKNKCIAEMKANLTDLINVSIDHFPNMQDHLEKYPNFVFQAEKYVAEICCYPGFRKQN